MTTNSWTRRLSNETVIPRRRCKPEWKMAYSPKNALPYRTAAMAARPGYASWLF